MFVSLVAYRRNYSLDTVTLLREKITVQRNAFLRSVSYHTLLANVMSRKKQYEPQTEITHSRFLKQKKNSESQASTYHTKI